MINANRLTKKRVSHLVYDLQFKAKCAKEIYGVQGGESTESLCGALFGPMTAENGPLYDAFMSRWEGKTVDGATLPAFEEDYKKTAAEMALHYPVKDHRITPEENAANKARMAQQSEALTARQKRAEELKGMIPEGCRAVAAVLEEDQSDITTDYFGSRTVRTVLLGYTRSKKDDFRILWTAKESFPDTAAVEMQERREKYSMGHGYYLCPKNGWKYSGWLIEWHGYLNGDEEIREGGLLNLDAPARAKEDTAAPCLVCGAPTDAENAGHDDGCMVATIVVRKNDEKGGIEIIFPDKPGEDVRALLKSYGFRWSRFQGLWWKKDDGRMEEYQKKFAA